MSDRDAVPTDGDVSRTIVRSPGFEQSVIDQLERGIEEEDVPWAVQRVEADDSGSDRQRNGSTAVAH